MNAKKLASLIVLASVIGLFAYGFAHAATSTAGGWADRLYNFFAPLFSTREPTRTLTNEKPATSTVPLYKPALDYERAVVAAVEKASPAVVSITISKNVPIIEQCPISPDIPPELRDFFGEVPQFLVPCERGSQFKEVGGGSGFIIQSDGLVLTNKHVVNDAKASYTVFTNDGKKYEAKVLARDPVQDLAVLKIEAVGLPTVELGDSDSIALGQTAIAIGNALGEFRNTVSVGVISGLARTVTAEGAGVSETIHGLLQSDAAINPGNSGGPLLNLKGEVVGINTAIVSGAQSIGFAIPVNRAKRAIRSVKASGAIETPYLGARYVPVTPEVAKREKLADDYGALLKKNADGPAVMPNSPAEKAGLKAGDVILEVNGKKIDKNTSLVDMIVEFDVGETVTLTVRRGTELLTLRATLEKRPQ